MFIRMKMSSLLTSSLVVLVFLAGLAMGRYIIPIQAPGPSITQKTGPGQGPVEKTMGLPPNSLGLKEASSKTFRLPKPPQAKEAEHTPPPQPVHPPQMQAPEPPTLADELKKQELKREMAASLRENGIPEEDIQRMVEGAFPAPPSLEEQYSPYELSADEKSPEQLKAELEASLKEAGVPAEEIPQHVAGVLGAMGKQPSQPEEPPLEQRHPR
jgi:hypothetical protein